MNSRDKCPLQDCGLRNRCFTRHFNYERRITKSSNWELRWHSTVIFETQSPLSLWCVKERLILVVLSRVANTYRSMAFKLDHHDILIQRLISTIQL
jgi:hypothetical protein